MNGIFMDASCDASLRPTVLEYKFSLISSKSLYLRRYIVDIIFLKTFLPFWLFFFR